jgi:small GTP-binding protein
LFFYQFLPTVMDVCETVVELDEATVTVTVWDTAGADQYDQLRRLSFPDSDIFLVCFCVVSPTSFVNAREKWFAEATVHGASPNAKVVLVGTKIDLRDDPSTNDRLRKKNMAPISREEGVALAKELGMAAYAETSALTGDGVQALFRACCAILLQREEPTPRSKAGGRKCVLQ